MPTKTKKPDLIIEEETALEPIQKPEETITFKLSHFYAVMVIFAFAVGVISGYFLWGRTPEATTQVVNQPAVQVEAQEPSYVRYDVSTEGYPSLGPADAPITIVEFSDFQCPFCKRFHDETYKALLEAYPGQIRFVYRNLPLTSIHPDAMPAAVASLCANEQNVYWEYHEKLFSSDALGRDIYVQYASDLNLNADEFNACLDSGKFDEFIQQDIDFAFNLGVQSTPTFFINGLAIVGAQPLTSFQQIIDKELAGEIP
jgi:protein-disulfide isomerase